MGLFKSIRKYNGKYDLMNYSIIYIKSELLKCITDSYSLSSLPKKERCKNKSTLSTSELIRFKQLLNVKLSGQYKPYQFDLLFHRKEDMLTKINEKYEEIEEIRYLTDRLSPFSKRVLYLKYFFHENKVLSNKYISTLMCCSEEQIRVQFKNIREMKDINNRKQ
jgi:RNA polymerase sigma factor (sigma-70 family)